MSWQAREAYLESRVLAADPVELVRILYQAAIEATHEARRCLAQGDVMGRSRNITRAHQILTELSLSLNHEAGGGLSRNLAELYDYMQRRLIQAHVSQTDAPLAEVARLLSTLLEGWQQCRPASEPTQPPLSLIKEEALEYARHSWSA